LRYETIADPHIVVVDYGIGNLLSVVRAIDQCGFAATCTSDPKIVQNAKKIILPGVGAFPKGMKELLARGFVQPIQEAVSNGTPLLGICLGMQLLLEESEEFGVTQGLGIIPGKVVSIPQTTSTGLPMKMPSIGWSCLIPADGSRWEGSLLENHSFRDAVYFVHSFMAVPRNESARLADYLYGGHKIPAVISQGRVVGCQFHPEKSGKSGLAFLQHFLMS
jgi:glutamine amidotransferase